ncbi:MAG: hypothetical protein LBR65_02200 [Culturomica sp.]|jgi:hypothetical protein|nr:hypothetical protein [Culturomica sp.]
MKSRLLLLVTLLISFSACNDDRTDENWQEVAGSEIVVNNNLEELETRVIASPEKLETPVIASRSGQTSISGLKELANIKPITLDDKTLSATAVQTFGNYAVIAYHSHHEGVGGGVDLIDISDVTNPVLVSSLTYSDRDVNHVLIRSTGSKEAKFYMLADDSKKGKAYVVEGRIQNGQFANDGFREIPLLGNSSNSAQIYELYLFTGTTGIHGTDGAFQTINLLTGENIATAKVDRAHHIDFNKNCMVTLSLTHAGEARLSYYYYHLNIAAPTSTLSLGTISTIDGKNVVRLRDNRAYVALSDGGWKVVSLSASSAMTVKHEEPGQPGSLVNGLDVSNDYIFVSHGSEGLRVYDKKTYALLGQFSSDGGSANYNSVNDAQTLLLAANGIGGTKIISVTP